MEVAHLGERLVADSLPDAAARSAGGGSRGVRCATTLASRRLGSTHGRVGRRETGSSTSTMRRARMRSSTSSRAAEPGSNSTANASMHQPAHSSSPARRADALTKIPLGRHGAGSATGHRSPAPPLGGRSRRALVRRTRAPHPASLAGTVSTRSTTAPSRKIGRRRFNGVLPVTRKIVILAGVMSP